MRDKKPSDAVVDYGTDLVSMAAGVPLPATMLRLLVDEANQRRSVVLQAAEDLAGCSREELADRLRDAPRTVSRLARLLHAAGVAGHEQVLRMMGYLLTRSLFAEQEGRRIDEDEDDRILETLIGLEPRHVVMLALIDQQPGIDNVALARALPSDRFTDQTSSDLLARGYVGNPYGRYGGANGEDRFWETSDLGRLVLQLGAAVGLTDKENQR